MRLPHPTESLGKVVFGIGARAYDLLTAQPIWREQIARLLALAPPVGPERVLDLGTGPGVSAFVLAERLPTGSSVVGVDLAPQMIALARAELGRRGQGANPIAFEVGDATRLPWGDGEFERVTGHSFLYLLPDPVAVLREVRRLLKPGGVATFMEPAAAGSLWMAARAAPAPWPTLAARPWDTLRFSTSMALWRLMSGAHRRWTQTHAAAVAQASGLRLTDFRPTLGGLGVHLVFTIMN